MVASTSPGVSVLEIASVFLAAFVQPSRSYSVSAILAIAICIRADGFGTAGVANVSPSAKLQRRNATSAYGILGSHAGT